VYSEVEHAPTLDDESLQNLRDEAYDIIRTIHDPEHPQYTLQDLRVIQEQNISVSDDNNKESITVAIVPTVPHCSLATLIGLCVRFKLEKNIPGVKITVNVKPGTHNLAAEISKQLNDKERVCAALDNEKLMELVALHTRPPTESENMR